MNGVAHIGLALALAAPVALAIRQKKDDAWRLALTLIVLTAVIVAMQAALMRPRPGGGPLWVLGLPFYSFPSGHAAAAFAAATYWTAAYPRGVGPWALLGAGLVGAARVLEGVHFPSDVIAGAALGAGFAIAGFGCRRVDRTTDGPVPKSARRPAWAWLLFPWLGMMVAMGAWATAGIGSVEALFFADADKAIHFLAFGLAGFFAVGWWFERPVYGTIGILAGITVLEEQLQMLWPGRTVDPADALASVLGLAMFGLLARAIAPRARDLSPQP